MIQRIQSLLLLASAVIFGLLFQFPLATSEQPSVQFLSDSVFNIMDHVALLGLTIVGILLSLTAIFLFRKRSVQVRLGYFIIVVAILLPLIRQDCIYRQEQICLHYWLIISLERMRSW